MSHTVIDAADVEPSFGVFRKMRAALGVSGFGINQLELPPGASGRQHDEAEGGQEEVYIVISGSGAMRTARMSSSSRAGGSGSTRATHARRPPAPTGS
jgi:uncharacterized cupin superfamily protein